jgi:centromeric protein E
VRNAWEADSHWFRSQRKIKELEFVTKRYEENLGEPLRAVKEDVEKEWVDKVEALDEKLRMQDSYVQECERALEKERQVPSPSVIGELVLTLFQISQARRKLEEEKRALALFVADLDAALPTLRSNSNNNSRFRPTLGALAEFDPNTPSASPSKSGKTQREPLRRTSSLTMKSNVPSHATLLDQVAPEEVHLPDTDTEDKENEPDLLG